MVSLKIIFCTTLVLLCWSYAVQAESTDLPKTETPVAKKKTTTTTASTSTTSSTTPKTTTTTLAPTSTTTTTTTPTPTTEPPKTTTTPAPIPTTTHAPQPAPKPDVGNWTSPCIMMRMAAQLNFTYETASGNLSHGQYNIPVDAKVEDSECKSQTTQTIDITWGGATHTENSMVLQFDKKNDTTLLTMLKVHLSSVQDIFPDAKVNQTLQLVHRGMDFNTPSKMSYYCTRDQKLNLTEVIGDQNIIGTITVGHVQVEAFRSDNNTIFSSVHDCDSSSTSDVVPIAVGLALAALIIVVLVSYLCARRRANNNGYLSF